MKKGGPPPMSKGGAQLNAKRKTLTMPASKNMFEEAAKNQKTLTEEYGETSSSKASTSKSNNPNLVDSLLGNVQTALTTVSDSERLEQMAEMMRTTSEAFGIAKSLAAKSNAPEAPEGASKDSGLEEASNNFDKLENSLDLFGDYDEQEEDQMQDGFKTAHTDGLSDVLKDIRSRNFRLRDPKSTNSVTKDNKETFVDVTAEIQKNPYISGNNHSAYTDFFKTSPGQSLGGISFAETPILDTHFYFWPDFKTVSELNVSFCPNLTDFGVRLIKDAFPKLKKINISGCRLITEVSLRFLSGETLNAMCNMTNVRYVPNGLRFAGLEVKGCPLLIQEEAATKSFKQQMDNFESLLPSFSFVKVVVIKPDEMLSRHVAAELLKPDGEVFGSTSYLSSYRSGRCRVIECIPNAPLRLFLTNNCLVILPFDGELTDAAKIYKSVEGRLNLVSSQMVNFQALAVPLFKSATNSKSASLPDSSFEEIKKEHLAASKKASASPSDKEKRQPESNPKMARNCYYLANHLEFLPTSSTVAHWIAAREVHIDIPSYNFLLFEHLQKSNLLDDQSKPFLDVNSLQKIMPKDMRDALLPCWTSFADILAETGNCWLEKDETSPTSRPFDVIASLPSYISFIENFNNAKDKTALELDVKCVPYETPFCSTDRLRQHLVGLNDETASRMLKVLEETGLGIFNSKRGMALAFSNLPVEPHVPLPHFAIDLEKETPTKRTFTVTCPPSSLLPQLVTMLTKVHPPTLLWKGGAFFVEAASLDIWVGVDEVLRTIEITLWNDCLELASDADKAATTSAALIYGICAIALDRYCLLDPAVQNGSKPPDLADVKCHSMTLFDSLENDPERVGRYTPRTFSREFDLSLPRCERCFLTSEVLSQLQRYQLTNKPNTCAMSVKFSKAGHLETVLQVPLSLTRPTSFGEILNVNTLKTCFVCINHKNGKGSFLKLTFAGSSKELEMTVQLIEKISSNNDENQPSEVTEVDLMPDMVKNEWKGLRLAKSQLRLDFALKGQSVVIVSLSSDGCLLVESEISKPIADVVNVTLLSEVPGGLPQPAFVYTRDDEAKVNTSKTRTCKQSISSLIWQVRNGLVLMAENPKELDTITGSGFIFALLPSNLTWQSVCWPSKAQFMNETQLRPNFLCTWRPLMHFINEQPVIKSLEAPSQFSRYQSCLAIIKMLDQPHFLPDPCEKLFPELQEKCPFLYPSMSVASGANDNTDGAKKRDEIEHVLRKSFFPFFLDFMTACLGMDYVPHSFDEDYESQVSGCKKHLEAEGDKNDLLVVPYFDLLLSSTDWRRVVCQRHAAHGLLYDGKMNANSRMEQGDAKLASEMPTDPSDYDSLLTTFVCLPENANNADLASRHPLIAELYLGECKLIDMPEIFLTLKYLSTLILRQNSLATLPDSLALLSGTLQYLDVSLNEFTELPPVIFKLKELQSLRADFLSLSTLDDNVGNLQQLGFLSLRSNCLKKLPSSLGSLMKLQILDLSGLPLFGSMEYLEEAGSFMQKNKFPLSAAPYLMNFQENLGSTGVTRFTDRTIEMLNEHMFKVLPRLELIDGVLPAEILALTNLRELNLAYQPIISIPDDIEKLPLLNRLDLTGCLLLKTISPKISNAPLQMLAVHNCPFLSTPPAEIRKRGFAATTAYFRRLALGSVNVQRTKLMFVGLGGAGKTSLVNALMNPKNKGVADGSNTLPVTDGIDITDWAMPSANGSIVDFRLWDFAGQVVYYNTHQFFLSNRAVYLIMWNIRLGHEHAGLDFWLSSIACHAPQASVIVVGTHADQVPEERSFLPELAYRERFTSICGFHYVSSHTGKGIDGLRKHILEVALAQKHMGEAIPAAWLAFEGKILEARTERKSKQKDDKKGTNSSIMMLSNIQALADASGIYEEDELNQTLTFFTDLGTLQYFNTDFLRDRVIVNPQWIVDVMACVVSIKTSSINDGRLLHADMPKLWNEYPASLHPWLLKLTEAFDLTFPLRNEPVSIVPCMLPENAPADFVWPNLEDRPDCRQTELLLLFKYLPTGLFNRVQVRLCQLSEAKMWRRGSLLHKNKHVALITQRDATSVQVKVQGQRPENISFLILEVFDSLINESFAGIQPEYLFSCPECVNVRAAEPSMFERSRIRRATELHIPVLQCYHYFHQIPTRELRQLLPAESVGDFDFQLSRTVQQLSGIAQSLQYDVIVFGSSQDSGDTKNFTNAAEVALDLEKSVGSTLKVVSVTDPDSMSFDQLSLMVRSARLVVCCLSPSFMASDNCQAALLCARETLRKPVLVVLVREMNISSDDSLTYFIGDQVYVKAINRQKYKPAEVAEASRRRLNEVERATSASRVKHPNVFISYCWQNSKDAVDRGTRPREGSVGVTDPRALKKYLVEHGNFDCWLDIEQTGRGGLFEDIAAGLRHAKVVVVCVSDEYVESKNCVREFRFATSACQLPLVICVVGTGMAWKQSEISFVVPPSTPVFNFQIDAKPNYDKLLAAIKLIVNVPIEPSTSTSNDGSNSGGGGAKPSLGAIGRIKTMDKIQRAPTTLTGHVGSSSSTTEESRAAVFREMRELEQRRFLRQISSFAETASTSKLYPRLIIVDIDGGQDANNTATLTVDQTRPTTARPVSSFKAKRQQEPDGDQNNDQPNNEPEETGQTNDVFSKLQWCVRTLCEHEDGWHPTDVTYRLSPATASGVILKSAGYLGRVFSLLNHSTSALPQLMAPSNPELGPACEASLQQIEKLVRFEETFEPDYVSLLTTVMSLDQHKSLGGLSLCQLSIGKELWLCEQHQSSAQYRMKGKAMNSGDAALSSNNLSEADHQSASLGATFMPRRRPLKLGGGFGPAATADTAPTKTRAPPPPPPLPGTGTTLVPKPAASTAPAIPPMLQATASSKKRPETYKSRACLLQ